MRRRRGEDDDDEVPISRRLARRTKAPVRLREQDDKVQSLARRAADQQDDAVHHDDASRPTPPAHAALVRLPLELRELLDRRAAVAASVDALLLATTAAADATDKPRPPSLEAVVRRAELSGYASIAAVQRDVDALADAVAMYAHTRGTEDAGISACTDGTDTTDALGPRSASSVAEARGLLLEVNLTLQELDIRSGGGWCNVIGRATPDGAKMPLLVVTDGYYAGQKAHIVAGGAHTSHAQLASGVVVLLPTKWLQPLRGGATCRTKPSASLDELHALLPSPEACLPRESSGSQTRAIPDAADDTATIGDVVSWCMLRWPNFVPTPKSGDVEVQVLVDGRSRAILVGELRASPNDSTPARAVLMGYYCKRPVLVDACRCELAVRVLARNVNSHNCCSVTWGDGASSLEAPARFGLRTEADDGARVVRLGSDWSALLSGIVDESARARLVDDATHWGVQVRPGLRPRWGSAEASLLERHCGGVAEPELHVRLAAVALIMGRPRGYVAWRHEESETKRLRVTIPSRGPLDLAQAQARMAECLWRLQEVEGDRMVGEAWGLLGLDSPPFDGAPARLRARMQELEKAVRGSEHDALAAVGVTTTGVDCRDYVYMVDDITHGLPEHGTALRCSLPTISAINQVDSEPLPNIDFLLRCVPGEGVQIETQPEFLTGCSCGEACGRADTECSCSEEQLHHSKVSCAYGADGRLVVPVGSYIFECNSQCSCGPDCPNRIVQRGLMPPLQVYKTKHKGWAMRSLERIREGTFVCEYTGEILQNDEAERRGVLYDRAGFSTLFDLDAAVESDDCLYAIDATHCCGVARFLNHSCAPNLVLSPVWVDNIDLALPRIAFFAARDIEALEELVFDYKYERKGGRKVECFCGAPSCRKWLN